MKSRTFRRTFPDADLEAHKLLSAFGRGAENNQNTLGLGLHPGLQIDAIGPDIDIPPGREIAALPGVKILLPLPGRARNHAWRQVRRIRAEERRERLLKVAGGNAAQIEHRQQGIEAPRAPCRSGQDIRGKSHLLVIGPGSTVTHLRARTSSAPIPVWMLRSGP